MHKLNLILLLLLIPSIVQAAAPTRAFNYVAHTTIDPTQNNTNENALYTYLQAGVDTYSAGTIMNADVSSSAGIAYSKLNLIGSITNSDISTSAAIVGSKLDLSIPGAIGGTTPSTGAFTTLTGTTLKTTGNVGIGTTVINAGRLLISGGNVGIGTTHPNVALDVIGQVRPSTGILFGDGTSQTTAGSNTWKFISKTSMSVATNSGNIAITNTNYYFVTIHISASTGVDSLSLRFNDDSAAARHGYVYRGWDFGATASNSNSNMAATLIQMGPIFSFTNYGADYWFYIYPQVGVGLMPMNGRASGKFNSSSIGGYADFNGAYDGTTGAVTSFKILSTGGESITGDINLYQIQQQ